MSNNPQIQQNCAYQWVKTVFKWQYYNQANDFSA